MRDCLPDKISWITNPGARETPQPNVNTSAFSSVATRHARRFHRTLPSFKATPLAKLDNLARQLDVASIRVKDESHRCGLNAFKIDAADALSNDTTQFLYLIRDANHERITTADESDYLGDYYGRLTYRWPSR